MDSIITFIAKYAIIVPVLVAAYVWWKLNRKQRKDMLIFLICLIALSLLFAKIGEHLYVNPRPPFKDGATPLFTPSDYNGFPSDHTLFASALAFGVLRYRKNLGLALLGLSVIIGWSRVAAHVHHAIDVVGALAMTTAAYYICIKLVPILEKRLRRG
jgi:undecaprenyl-diphosphatase